MIRGRTLALAIAGVAVAIQFVPIRRDNPPTASTVPAPSEVNSILRRSCYNCHSHETTWPWYSHVAPVSWLVARDVHEGRRHVNFSDWSKEPPNIQQKRLLDLVDEVQHGDMPPWYYTPMHSNARLSQADIDTLVEWAEASSAKLAGKP